MPDNTLNTARLKVRHFERRKQPPLSTVYTVYDYDAQHLEERELPDEAACAIYHSKDSITWINIDGLNEQEVTRLCEHYKVHTLVIDDILSLNERAKMEETGDVIHCVLPMMFFNELRGEVELEQVTIVLGKNFVLSFQEEPTRDVFDPIRRHLQDKNSKIRERTADYLCYSLLDLIVDSYFDVLEKLAGRLETLENELLVKQTKRQLARISSLRGDVTMVRRAVFPVRELVARFVRSDNILLEERHEKYFRDVLDHTIQVNDLIDNHRDMLMNLQDLYMNQINLRMNEVMKTFTMVATLLAPATVIGGIFGMNFDVIPLTHHSAGFWIAVGLMLIIPVFMLFFFKRKGWF